MAGNWPLVLVLATVAFACDGRPVRARHVPWPQSPETMSTAGHRGSYARHPHGSVGPQHRIGVGALGRKWTSSRVLSASAVTSGVPEWSSPLPNTIESPSDTATVVESSDDGQHSLTQLRTAAVTGVPGTSSRLLAVAVEVIATSAAIGVPESCATPRRLTADTVSASDGLSGSAKRLAVVITDETRAANERAPIAASPSELIVSTKLAVTSGTTCGVSEPPPPQHLHAAMIGDGHASSSPRLVSNTFAADDAASVVPAESSSQHMSPETARATVAGVSESSSHLGSRTVVASDVSEWSSPQFSAPETSTVRLGATRKNWSDLSDVGRATGDNVTPRCHLSYDQTNISHDHRSSTTHKCDPADSVQDEQSPSNDTKLTSCPGDDQWEYHLDEENSTFFSRQSFIFMTVVVLLVLMSYLIVSNGTSMSTDQSEKDGINTILLEDVKCECHARYNCGKYCHS